MYTHSYPHSYYQARLSSAAPQAVEAAVPAVGSSAVARGYHPATPYSGSETSWLSLDPAAWSDPAPCRSRWERSDLCISTYTPHWPCPKSC